MIKDLTIKEIHIPFRVSFKHASAERAKTEGIWVEAVSETGERGFGEACPRSYVTGETVESTIHFFSTVKAEVIQDVGSLHDLRAWVAQNKQAIDENPAAWCAIELALLDLFAREAGTSVETLLAMPPLQGRFHYSAVVGDGSFPQFQTQMKQYLSMGFHDVKVKISGELEKDREKLDWLTQVAAASTPDLRLRVDANNLWATSDACIAYFQNLGHPLMAIEEPLAPNHYHDLHQISTALQTKIILDESFLRIDQFDALSFAPDIWILNLRVSKMGGLIRTIAIAEKARAVGMPIIVGAQVGETSVLTRAGLSVAHYTKDILLAQEGAFGLHLLERDVCQPPLMFGAKGILDTSTYALDQAVGFGLNFYSG
ncbi:MAG: enolase C-terminal domain-like protein [Chloroflexota bacterium]